ncbi:hypothetical protein HELRODRAFT_176155 [Helobdella robusta]|uniref:Uncharacterized protein n=1 Tax=Helobdella robusta TaxID=6412 RepID=T1FA79_HELRO|nr:hypothetical protein HELRODRAFT_176155 [Helobdella robusta]ESO00290.1 hypothetical protein HELRODRAFT_176155 [Helobdella robusta]
MANNFPFAQWASNGVCRPSTGYFVAGSGLEGQPICIQTPTVVPIATNSVKATPEIVNVPGNFGYQYKVAYIAPHAALPATGAWPAQTSAPMQTRAQYPVLVDLGQLYKKTTSGPVVEPQKKKITTKYVNECCIGCNPCCCGEKILLKDFTSKENMNRIKI